MELYTLSKLKKAILKNERTWTKPFLPVDVFKIYGIDDIFI